MSVFLRSLAASMPLAIAAGQTPPSVLALQKSYHVGRYSTTIVQPTGVVLLAASRGSMTLSPNGALTASVATYQSTVTGTTLTPNDSFAGTYHVAPSGIATLDLNPGTANAEQLQLWIDTTGGALHGARNQPNPKAHVFLALETSTGQTIASLIGAYGIVGQRVSLLVGSVLMTDSVTGVLTFDGAGGTTYSGTETVVTGAATTTVPWTGAGSYTVAADGAISIDGAPGGMSANGEVLFTVPGNAASGQLGLTIAVRLGTTYDLHTLDGRYGLHGLQHALGLGPTLPQTTSVFGELRFAAATATSGSWTSGGMTVTGNATTVQATGLAGAGGASLTANGTLTLPAAAGAAALEFRVSSSGRYAVGRAVVPQASVYFAMRQCAFAQTYGAGTPGTGGAMPVVGMSGFPTLGNQTWALTIAGALGGSFAAMPIGTAAWPGVPALGGLLWIDPGAVAYVPLIALSGVLGVPGAGAGATAIPIPNNTGLLGWQLYAQGMALDFATPAGFAMTGGFQAGLCR